MTEPVSGIAATQLPGPVRLSDIDGEAREVIATCLRLARERLGMTIAWLGEFTGDSEIFRLVEGELDDWTLWDDYWLPAADSYCQRMLQGRIGNLIRDSGEDREVCELGVTQALGIGSYAGVPLVLRTGELRGAFCCARHTPNHELDERDVRFMQVLARVVAEELGHREAAARARRLEAQAAAGDALAVALEARDGYSAEHSHAVVELACAVARRLGLGEDGCAAVAQVALLHDIGKVGIPDAVLRKPGPLTEAEWAVMRRHPEIGAELVAGIAPLAHLAPAVAAEHEAWDGSGYPAGLTGEAIPVESRITLVCDAYHAMVSDRPYRAAIGEAAARAELQRCSGGAFWPDAVAALLAELDERS